MEGPTHGVPGGGRSVDGCGRQSWRVMRLEGFGGGGRLRAGLLGSVACGGGGCVLLPVSYYEEVMRVTTASGLRPERPEGLGGEWCAGGGLSPAGIAGVPWGPVGGGGSPRWLGAKTGPVFPSPKFLGFDPRNLPAAGTVGRDGQEG